MLHSETSISGGLTDSCTTINDYLIEDKVISVTLKLTILLCCTSL